MDVVSDEVTKIPLVYGGKRVAHPVRLDLGAGASSPAGYTPVGHAHGSEIFPLPYADGTVAEIRASHCLEHFPTSQVREVLADWVRTLRPGGVLRVAVPDFTAVAQRYLDGVEQPTEGYVVGGQVDKDDFHRSVFDADKLKGLLREAGLLLLRPWKSELKDCAALPISLNLQGTKPFRSTMSVAACMSVPRLGFMDFFFCAMQALIPLQIKLHRMSSVFWGQSMTRCIEHVIERENPDAILTIDYDTVFTKTNVGHLIQLMACNERVDAIAPMQSHRKFNAPMFSKGDSEGKNQERSPLSDFAGDLTPIRSAHFGLTLIDTAKIKALPHPWFHADPGPDGRWETGHVDEDVKFWLRWREAGNTLFLANRVAVGHADMMVRWPGRDLGAIYQTMFDFNEKGPPEEVWK